ncbi:g9562 [Coccomyxa viridis]|uniref:G9562 protein n=1 Tax=Coccomyxa viridis TaxID=1274662 RepID=A0ABP1G600_9CHLO
MSSIADRGFAFSCTISIVSDGFTPSFSKQFAAVGANRREAETTAAGDVLKYLIVQFSSSVRHQQHIPSDQAATEFLLNEAIYRNVRQITVSDVHFGSRPEEMRRLAHTPFAQQEEIHLPHMSAMVEWGIRAELQGALLEALAKMRRDVVYKARHVTAASSVDTLTPP